MNKQGVELGRGIQGVITKMERDSQHLALKTYNHTAKGKDGGLSEIFLREISLMVKLQGKEGVVQGISFDITKKEIIAMEYMNTDLYRLSMTTSLDDRRKMYNNILSQLKTGLGNMHSLGFIHRDFKPENILVRYTGDTVELRICDFGSSIHTMGREWIDCDTICYPNSLRPPEVEMMKKYNHTADVWSLFITMVLYMSGCRLDTPPDEIKQIPRLDVKYRGRVTYKHIGERVDMKRYLDYMFSDSDIRMMEITLSDMSVIDPSKRLSLHTKDKEVHTTQLSANDDGVKYVKSVYTRLSQELSYSDVVIDAALSLYVRSKIYTYTSMVSCFILVSKVLLDITQKSSVVVLKSGYNISPSDILSMEKDIVNAVSGAIIL